MPMLGVVVIQLLDAPRAHPHCKVHRYNVYIEAPKDLGLDPSQCLRLKRCSYVTRDEGQAFVVETSSGCTIFHKCLAHRAYTDGSFTADGGLL